jgi:hypothetical protein
VYDKEIKSYRWLLLKMFHYNIERDPKIDPPSHGKSITYRIAAPANCSSWVWVYGVGDDGVPAFTKDGIENLRQIIADQRNAGRAPPELKSDE